MRYIVINKVDATTSGVLSQPVVDQLGAYIGDASDSGVFKDGAQLAPSSQRARIEMKTGKPSVITSPYQGDHELVASLMIITAQSTEKAIDVATKIAEALGGDLEIEVSPISSPWEDPDAEPPDGSSSFVLLRMADATSEAGAISRGRPKLFDDLESDGVLLNTITLYPSRTGARMDSSRMWSSGPFTSSKALVAGYSIVEFRSPSDAKKWAEDYGAILGKPEVEVRQIDDGEREEHPYSLIDGRVVPI